MGTDPVTLLVHNLTYTFQFVHPFGLSICRIEHDTILVNPIVAGHNNRLQRIQEDVMMMALSEIPEK
jgi:hypothetical protein